MSMPVLASRKLPLVDNQARLLGTWLFCVPKDDHQNTYWNSFYSTDNILLEKGQVDKIGTLG